MVSLGRPDGNSVVLVLFGSLLVLGSVFAPAQAPATEYHTSVESFDDAEGANASEIGYTAYEFEDLSPQAQTQFLAARNHSTRSTTFSDEDKKAPEFQYGEHGATVTYVVYEGGYYQVATSSSGCFAAVCDAALWLSWFVALAGIACIGFGLWRAIEWEG